MATITCFNCKTSFEAPDSVTTATCPACGANVTSSGASATPTPAVPAAAPAVAPTAAPAHTHTHDAKAAAAAAFADSSPLGEGSMRPILPRIMDGLIDKIRGLATERSFNGFSRLGLFLGELLIYAAIVILFLVTFIHAIRANNLSSAMKGLGMAVAAILLLYIALQMTIAGAKLLRTSPTRISSRIYMNCLVVIFVAIGIWAIAQPFQQMSGMPGAVVYELIVDFLLGSVPFFAGAVLALNPSLLNIEISGETSSGETFIGLASFILKAAIALLPITLGIGALITINSAIVGLCTNDEYESLGNADWLLNHTLLLPIVVMLSFLAYYLIVDLCRAILSIPKNKI